MTTSVDGVPVPAATAGPARPRSRRELLRVLLAPAAALVLTPVVAASWPTDPHPDPTLAGPGSGFAFDEVYRGRRIQGVPTRTGGRAAAVDPRWQVTVDGRPLHLMRRADGTWLSMVDHYRSYPTPLEAARAAVDELGPGEQLRDTGEGDGGTEQGGHHGLHA
ncbi:tyrosinase cofactor [Streptomyces phaeofaciens JCM 4814]|uniref:Tyrosinase n=1 Tax=Streptomyces phaeofaciens TaxID=68254 RepID=A0A918H7W3_9ACTN|nr:tyrosinase cofactor [Streptomyces phaeofaciens]GGT40961.1 tyrosinase [Streptomyces phaeofaciens]